ncbi:hypothetical protein FIV06_09065 [Labrenzia sp. THAF191b]|uniref:DUF935 domain-containing protein n=1 Tax=unclassified Labrenzia TaxID=2648686 RepID=UPI001267B6E5|nr:MULTISPECIES: DUF935 domain-containing protein [unclassified Labrenzia]QFS97570.1 hypothetical protein FIV06_09065 [Labrenzia sp. THAF191b]QFT03885.1 hypothetical protein FIV05_09065 [Labrenzia sp. THAF191a]QFT15427.1 hypothetical protein FIV03_09070 [Labrenzia sp. THAF187b]
MVGLIDQYGRPIEKAALSKEIATPEIMGVRRTIEDREASGLTPGRLAQILIDAQNGHARAYLTLAEEMEERYLHYASQLQTRRLAIEGLSPVVEAAEGVPTKIVDAVKELMDGADINETTGELTDGIGKGYSVCEIMWEYERKALRPVEYKWRDPRYFQFDRKSLTQLLLATDTNLDGEELPPAKFIVHKPRTKAGIPLRRGLARPAAWAFLIQSFGLKDWAAFSEIYGIPIRVGRYHSTASDQDKRTLLRAVKAIANDAAAIIPQGMDVEFHKVEGSHGSAVFGELLDYVDRQVSKVVVGQTMTADDGSSLAQAAIHNEVRLDINEADGKQMAATYNRDLIIPFVNMNFGPQEVYPLVSFPVAQPEDLEALTNALGTLVPMGLKVGQREVREKLALSEPSQDEEILTAPAVAKVETPANDPKTTKNGSETEGDKAKLAAHVAGCACATCASLSSDPNPDLDEFDRLFGSIDWEPVTDPLLAPLRKIILEASDFEDVRRRLDQAGPDSEPMRQSLARFTAITRGLGDVRDED